MSQASENRQFGKKQPSKVVISSNGKVREFRVHAGLLTAIGAVFTMFMVGYLGATAYLAFRDDLVVASFIKQTRMKHEYEDRIAALRSKVDRITSRQLLDQQAVEAKVADLMRQQEMLTGRSGALEGLLKRAKENGLGIVVPVPAPNPLKADIEPVDPMKTGSVKISNNVLFADATSFLRGSSFNGNAGRPLELDPAPALNEPTETVRVFANVLDQINAVANAQRDQVVALQSDAHAKAGKLVSIFDKLKIGLPAELTENIGGPFIPARTVDFDDLTEDLEQVLNRLETLKGKVRKLPVDTPLPGAPVSSSFGNRVDPFHRSSAFHSGIDFRAATGTPILASGAGKVVKAGSNGGYGLMVEIDHGNGITTRYAHMSKILVSVGDKVKNHQKIGKVGSTGRSTGPHLHYEIRRNDEASNPGRFLKVGNELKQLLKS